MKSHFKKIVYNLPHNTGFEIKNLKNCIDNNSFSGLGEFHYRCKDFFKEKFGFTHSFLTSSCSMALEMAARLIHFETGDEVIVPSYCYMSTAAAFLKAGAKVVFADSEVETPNISVESIKSLINKKTKALVVMHYGGIACNMLEIMTLVNEHQLILIEDCAHAIGAKYNHQLLGSYGHFSTFSFHETKNIHCGEGGLLVVNDENYLSDTIVSYLKGTNRKDFEEGKVPNYEWIQLGMNAQLAELNAAFLYAQLFNFESIQQKRLEKWNYYYNNLSQISSCFSIPVLKKYSLHNGHIFYLKFETPQLRELFRVRLNECGIMAIFHYQALHRSKFWLSFNEEKKLQNAQNWSNCLLRLPLYVDLEKQDQDFIIETIQNTSNY